MIEILENYNILKDKMATLISKSGYRNDFIAKKIGMAPAYFSVKKQRGNWTTKEMEKILNIIENESLNDYILGEIMKSREDEETVSYDEFKTEISSWNLL